MTLSCANLFWQSSSFRAYENLHPCFQSQHRSVCLLDSIFVRPGWKSSFVLITVREKIPHQLPFLISSCPLQFSTSRVFMGGTTTATLLPPAAEARPSCASAVGRFAVARWFESKTHTSTFSASPVKVKKTRKNTHLHTNQHVYFFSEL